MSRRAGPLVKELRSRRLPASAKERQRRLVNLAMFTAGVIIPLLAGTGAYHRAVHVAEAVRRAAMSKTHRCVIGEGPMERTQP